MTDRLNFINIENEHTNEMNILMLSIDKNILRPESDAALRVASYGRVVEELRVIVFSRNSGKAVQLARNVWAYPTQTMFSFFFFFDFYRIAKKNISENHVFSPKTEKASARGGSLSAGRQGVSGGKSWIITSQDAFTHCAALFIRRKLGVPVEVQVHTDFLSPYFRRESLKNYLRYKLYSYAVQKADTIRVVSPRIAENIERAFQIQPERITILPIFVDTRVIAQAPLEFNLRKKYTQFDFIVLMASRLTKEKNISLALEGFDVLVRHYPRAGLLIVGDGPERQNLEQRTKNLELTSNVIFESAVSFEKLVSYYKTADLFLLTSNYEGYGRTLVEAAAAKLPVITTDVGIAHQLFVNGVTGTIIPVGDRAALIAGLQEAIRNYQKYKAFGEKAGAMLLDKPESYEKYLQAMKMAWEKCLNMGKEVP
jgi:glycosyltransferase involved in cell wall biosynthesis